MTALAPTDAIPADILYAAGAVVADICDDTHMTLMGDVDKMAQPIARAILAERERCIDAAQETGNFGDYERDELTADFGQPRFDMMNEIISAIRNPPFAAPAVPHTTTPSSESPEGEAQSLSGEPIVAHHNASIGDA